VSERVVETHTALQKLKPLQVLKGMGFDRRDAILANVPAT
jgi:hypothetical protein